MKRLHIIPQLTIFVVCLTGGFLAGLHIGRSDEFPQPRASPTAEPVALQATFPPTAPITPNKATNGQRSVLLIGVDSLETDAPQLESAWLAAFFPTLPQITLLPIYPNQDRKFEASFALDEERTPVPAFLTALQAEDLWWDSYLIIDRNGLEELTGKIGGIDLGGVTVAGRQVLERLTRARHDPQQALADQITLLRAFCRKTPHLAQVADPDELSQLVASTARTDLAPEQISADLNALLDFTSGLTCEFPTLGKALLAPFRP